MWKKLNEFTIKQIAHYASIVNKDTHMITWKTKDGLLHIASYYTINNCVMDSDNSTKFSIWRYENDATNDEYNRFLNIIEFLMEEIKNVRRENTELKNENSKLITSLFALKENEDAKV